MKSPTEVINFGGNIRFAPRVQYRPKGIQDLLEVLDREPNGTIRAMGSLHAWSPATQTDNVSISLEHLNSINITRDEQGVLVTVEGGCKIERLIAELAKHQLAMPSLGLISEQTIAGATSTATHGSGRHCLSEYLTAIHLAHYDPATNRATVTQVRDPEQLRAAKCALGCMGIVIAVELRPRESFLIEEFMNFYEDIDGPLAMESEYPLQQFYYFPWYGKYLGQHRRETSKRRSALAPLYRFYWFSTIDIGLHIILTTLVQRLRSPKLAKTFFRSIAPLTLIRNCRVVDHSQDMLIMQHELFRHIEIEMFVTRDNLAEAMELTKELIVYFDSGEGLSETTRQLCEQMGLSDSVARGKRAYTHHYAICIRRILPDNMFLSMSSGGDQDFYALSFISYDSPSKRDGFYQFANILASLLNHRFRARCHWGKHNPHDRKQIEAVYPNLATFRTICDAFDPRGRFRNQWVQDLLFEPLNTEG